MGLYVSYAPVLGLDEATVGAVLADWRTAPVDALAHDARVPGDADPDARPDRRRRHRAVGLTDRAIQEAIYVCFLFNVMDRLADAFDFKIPPAKSAGRTAKFLYRMGYGGASVPG